jgi:anthranilate phosphoribosyltransferase
MPNDILTRAIDEICAGTHLTADHTSAALAEIMEGRASEVQTAAFLVSLRAKGETVSSWSVLPARCGSSRPMSNR